LRGPRSAWVVDRSPERESATSGTPGRNACLPGGRPPGNATCPCRSAATAPGSRDGVAWRGAVGSRAPAGVSTTRSSRIVCRKPIGRRPVGGRACSRLRPGSAALQRCVDPCGTAGRH
jgi:hypothetical protein